MSQNDIICKRRLLQDLRTINKDPIPCVNTVPNDKNMLIWHFIIAGPDGSDYTGGLYLGTLTHSSNYPFKPPKIQMLTPSGRFEINKDICLTNSSYHPDEWSVAWTTKSILMGLVSIMLDNDCQGIGHINASKEERQRYAKNSIEYNKKYSEILKSFT